MRLICLAALFSAALTAAPGVHFFQHPALSKTDIVFSYAGDLWRVPREGGTAVRLTGGAGFENQTGFSPQGKTIPLTREDDGNNDVYTVPPNGGTPKRLT